MNLDPLEQLFAARFYQASDIYEGTPGEILDAFGREEPLSIKRETAAALRVFLDQHPDDEGLAAAVERLGGSWPYDEVDQMRQLLERYWLEWSTASG